MKKENIYQLIRLGMGLFFILTVGVLLVRVLIPSVDTAFVYADWVRFHVVANSDSDMDQQIKMRVRDRVLVELGPLIGSVSGAEGATGIIHQNLGWIQSIAQAEVLQAGQGYAVKCELGEFIFPSRTYGETLLPAGSYKALRVLLGEGSGQNWWCVLFPPLCFVQGAKTPILEKELDPAAVGSDPLSPVMAPMPAKTGEREEVKKNGLWELRFKVWDWYAINGKVETS